MKRVTGIGGIFFKCQDPAKQNTKAEPASCEHKPCERSDPDEHRHHYEQTAVRDRRRSAAGCQRVSCLAHYETYILPILG